jgi:hypothetical protein
VPSGLVEKALKVSDKGNEFIELEVEFSTGYNAQAIIKMDGIKDFGIDGKYPDWQAVVPVKANKDDYVQTPALLNPDYNMDAVKANALLYGLKGNNKLPLLFKGLAPAKFNELSYAEACAHMNKVCAVHFGSHHTIVVMHTIANKSPSLLEARGMAEAYDAGDYSELGRLYAKFIASSGNFNIHNEIYDIFTKGDRL